MGKVKSIIRNEYVFAVVNKFYMVIIGLLHSILLARYLGADLKGEVSFIQNIVATGSVILTLGIHQAYPYFRKRNDPNKYKNVFMNSIITIYLFYTLVSVLISLLFCNNITVIISACIMPVFSYSIVSGYVMLVEFPNKRNLAISVIGTIEVLCLILLWIFAEKSLFWGIFAITIVEVLKSVYFTIALKIKLSVKQVSLRHIGELGVYGFFPMIALLMATLNYRIDIMMLKSFATITSAQIGIYSIGITISEKSLLISDAVKEILLSKLAKDKGGEEVAFVMRTCFPVSLIAAVIICLIGKPFMDIMYGSEYSGAYAVTLINMIGTVFMVFFKMISQYNIVNKKQIVNVIMLSVSVVLNIICNLIFVPLFGINGAALGSTIGYLACAVVFLIYFSKKSGIPIKDLILIRKDDLSRIKSISKKMSKQSGGKK